MRRQNGNENMKRSRQGKPIKSNTSELGEVVVGRPSASRNPLPPARELSMNGSGEGSHSNGSSRTRRLIGRHPTGRTPPPTISNEQVQPKSIHSFPGECSSSDCSRKRRNVVPLSRSTKAAKFDDDDDIILLDETDALSVTDKDEWKSMVAPNGTPCLVRFRFPCAEGSHTETIEVTLSTKLSPEMDVLSSVDGIRSLCERLRVERLLINSEVNSLRQLNNEISAKLLQLGLLSWNNKQQQLLLHRLVNSHSCVSQDNACAISSQLSAVEFEEAYRLAWFFTYWNAFYVVRKLGHHHSPVGRCLSILYASPLATAELLHAIGQIQELSSDDSIHAMFSLIYGNCVFPSDEKAVLETLNCLIRVQLLTHNNPRLVIRKGTAAFPRLYKLYSDSLYAAKIFLTAAFHDSVMLVLCQDEVFLDIDPAKSPLRFPSADRVRRFGDDPTSAQYHKRVAAHRKLIVEKLVLLAHSFIKGICDAISCFPLGLIWLVQQLNSSLTEIKRLPVTEAALICTDLIVTNLLCPAIINPENVGIISDTPISHIARFNLMQIGQIIQTLALSRYETPQPHFHIFAAQFKDSPICDIVGSLLSRSLDSFDSLFPPVLCESHRTRELFHRTYFMGSVAEVNSMVSVIHSNALSSVSADEVRTELDVLRGRLPKSFSTSSTHVMTESPADLMTLTQSKSNKMRNFADKVHNSLSTSPPHGSSRSHVSPNVTRLPQEFFDVVVFHMEGPTDPIGLIPEDKYMESLATGGTSKKHARGGTQKRTRFVDTGSNVGSAVSDRTPDNASDLEEDGAEQQEVGSISSSLEAPQEDRMLLLDEDGASTIPDNVSDVDETGLSGRGSASLDGRESPLSQAPSQGIRDGQENEMADLGAISTAAGGETDAAQRVLPSGVPVAVRKQNAEGLEEKFGKFTVPMSQQNRRDDQRSLLSDSWSTNVVPSDDEGPSLPLLPQLPSVDAPDGSGQRGRAVNRTGSLCGANAATEDRSDTWSLDAIASDSEADGGRERGRQARGFLLFFIFYVADVTYDISRAERNGSSDAAASHIAVPCVSVQPLVDVPQHGDGGGRLRRHSSGSSFSYSRSEADSEMSNFREDRERAGPTDSLTAARTQPQKQQSGDQPGPSGACASSFSSPSHSSAIGSAHDVEHYYDPSSPSNSGRKKFALFQQGLLKVGDKVRKGMTGSSFRQIPHSSTISDLLSEWNSSRRENESNHPAIPNSQSENHIASRFFFTCFHINLDVIIYGRMMSSCLFANFDQRSADDILAKYQPTITHFADEVQPPVELASSASESAPSEQVIAYYSPDNLTECRAFLDAKRKLRLVLSSVGNLPSMPFGGTCRGMKMENEREQLVMLLRTLLAEAVNNREQSLVAHTREVMRCLQIFDNKGEKAVVEECLVEVLVRFYLENKDQQMKRFLQEFVILNAQDEKTDCLLRTLTGMYTRLPVSCMWQSAPAHLIAYARKTIERVFMAQIHALAFYPNLDADRHRDECCETISNLISMAPGMGAAAADDVTPVLVYVLIQANPPSLLSNVQYVQGFGGSLLDGAEGYWWTQFTAAIEFIKTLL
ncbi:hypothetical protein GCK32_000111 [Trichostrongylus colubriformis]|uniref:GTPase activating protein and VPS9 domains 1 n=1 Tax=Trichostrongylus colubriformis TaxID=6319 RepID=A0AAN8FKA3_TRICO